MYSCIILRVLKNCRVFTNQKNPWETWRSHTPTPLPGTDLGGPHPETFPEGLLAQQEELLKAGSDDDFLGGANHFFFDMCFFLGVCVGGSQLFFLYRWGF